MVEDDGDRLLPEQLDRLRKILWDAKEAVNKIQLAHTTIQEALNRV